MKTINVTLEDSEFKELQKKKGSKTWRAFIMEGLK
jgi:hypothetical protein